MEPSSTRHGEQQQTAGNESVNHQVGRDVVRANKSHVSILNQVGVSPAVLVTLVIVLVAGGVFLIQALESGHQEELLRLRALYESAQRNTRVQCERLLVSEHENRRRLEKACRESVHALEAIESDGTRDGVELRRSEDTSVTIQRFRAYMENAKKTESAVRRPASSSKVNHDGIIWAGKQGPGGASEGHESIARTSRGLNRGLNSKDSAGDTPIARGGTAEPGNIACRRVCEPATTRCLSRREVEICAADGCAWFRATCVHACVEDSCASAPQLTLARPLLSRPDFGTVLYGDHLDWAPVAYATVYRVFVAKSRVELGAVTPSAARCVGCILNETTVVNFLELPPRVLERPGVYYWAVRAGNPQAGSPLSAISTFTID